MAARKATNRPKKGAAKGTRRKAARGHERLRRWLPLGLLGVGVLMGIGIGFGLAMLPPAPVAQPVAMDVPAAPVVAKKKAEPQPVPPAPIQPKAGSSDAALVTLPPSPVPSPASSPAPTSQSLVLPSSSVAPAEPALTAQPPAQVMTPQTAALLPPESMPAESLPAWLRNAASYQDPGTRPMIAIVLDDVGVAPQHARAALELPAPVVLSIMTYAEKGETFAGEARRRGHEVMVHMPMQPLSASVDPGPNALTVGLEESEIRRRVEWGLSRFGGYIGFNNHMGSKFTQDAAGMRIVLEVARERGLLFLDSKTISGSVGDRLAGEMGVTHIARDVFLDDTLTESAIARQLAAVEVIARKRGYAVAIGHPHPATIAVLKRWLPEMAARGIAIVPLTAIVKKRDGVSG